MMLCCLLCVCYVCCVVLLCLHRSVCGEDGERDEEEGEGQPQWDASCLSGRGVVLMHSYHYHTRREAAAAAAAAGSLMKAKREPERAHADFSDRLEICASAFASSKWICRIMLQSVRACVWYNSWWYMAIAWILINRWCATKKNALALTASPQSFLLSVDCFFYRKLFF